MRANWCSRPSRARTRTRSTRASRPWRLRTQPLWEVPYLPIDPMDLGRSYEAVIRINSQSGKGGIAYILEKEHGIELPRRLQIEFSKVVQAIADGEGVELAADRLWSAFEDEYLDGNGRYGFVSHSASADHTEQDVIAKITVDGNLKTILGHGNGPVDGFVDAIRKESGLAVRRVRLPRARHGHGLQCRGHRLCRIAPGRWLHAVRRRHRQEHRGRPRSRRCCRV